MRADPQPHRFQKTATTRSRKGTRSKRRCRLSHRAACGSRRFSEPLAFQAVVHLLNCMHGAFDAAASSGDHRVMSPALLKAIRAAKVLALDITQWWCPAKVTFGRPLDSSQRCLRKRSSSSSPSRGKRFSTIAAKTCSSRPIRPPRCSTRTRWALEQPPLLDSQICAWLPQISANCHNLLQTVDCAMAMLEVMTADDMSTVVYQEEARLPLTATLRTHPEMAVVRRSKRSWAW